MRPNVVSCSITNLNEAERSKRLFPEDLEEEVERLESQKPRTKFTTWKPRRNWKIYQKKEEYPKKHPDQRRLVYRKMDGDKPNEEMALQKRNFFDKKGLHRHPDPKFILRSSHESLRRGSPGMPYRAL
ncbi:hypothetical protein B0H11DRAFT_2306054 [Mycena galericulata]|nr:hypothetical protein B0H11DRAFT_2306054 [Mycena galericulata]